MTYTAQEKTMFHFPKKIFAGGIRIILIFPLLFVSSVFAVDASNDATKIFKVGHWQIIEFSMPNEMMYRISSSEIKSVENHITFDFLPSKKCMPAPAMMIAHEESYVSSFDKGIIPFSWKIPGEKEDVDLANTEMENGSEFAFFQLHRLTAIRIARAKDKGNLAIWITPSGDGSVKKSSNIYFPLEGFNGAYKKAVELCKDNL